jgi:hypothetical protein
MKTDVIFRMEGDSPLAIFPAITEDRLGRSVACYAHIGQHASCDIGYASRLRPATPEQYADLQRELVRLGYDLNTVSRFTPTHRKIRLGQVYVS